jgi:hypothetical protein
MVWVAVALGLGPRLLVRGLRKVRDFVMFKDTSSVMERLMWWTPPAHLQRKKMHGVAEIASSLAVRVLQGRGLKYTGMRAAYNTKRRAFVNTNAPLWFRRIALEHAALLGLQRRRLLAVLGMHTAAKERGVQSGGGDAAGAGFALAAWDAGPCEAEEAARRALVEVDALLCLCNQDVMKFADGDEGKLCPCGGGQACVEQRRAIEEAAAAKAAPCPWCCAEL